MKMRILLEEKINEVDAALLYPVFMASIGEPKSRSGAVCDWLEPRLIAAFEQWRAWQKDGGVQSALTVKIEAEDKKKKQPLAASPPLYERAKEKPAVERAGLKSKTETKISGDLDEIFG